MKPLTEMAVGVYRGVLKSTIFAYTSLLKHKLGTEKIINSRELAVTVVS